MSSNWQPNLDAKPFIPSSAAYVIQLPCLSRPIKIRRRGVLGRFLQLVLVSVLVVTVVFNVLFIIDNSKRLRTAHSNNPSYPSSSDVDDEVEKASLVLDQKDKDEGLYRNFRLIINAHTEDYIHMKLDV